MSRRKGNSPAGPTRTSRTIKQTDFESIARAYLRNLQRAYGRAVATGQGTPELSFRPELNEFLRNVSSLIHSDIESIFEPRRQAKSGRPDWRFYNTQTLGLYGYIEAKAFDTRTGIRTAAFTT